MGLPSTGIRALQWRRGRHALGERGERECGNAVVKVSSRRRRADFKVCWWTLNAFQEARKAEPL